MSSVENNAGLYAELDSLREESGEKFDDINELRQLKQKIESNLEKVETEMSAEIEAKAKIDQRIVEINEKLRAKKIIEKVENFDCSAPLPKSEFQ